MLAYLMLKEVGCLKTLKKKMTKQSKLVCLYAIEGGTNNKCSFNFN